MNHRPADPDVTSFDDYLREGTQRTLADKHQALSCAHAAAYMDAVKARHQAVLRAAFPTECLPRVEPAIVAKTDVRA